MIVFNMLFFNGFNILNNKVIQVKNQINHNVFHDLLLFFIDLNLFLIISNQKYLIKFVNIPKFSIVFSLVNLNKPKMLINKSRIHFL